MVSHSGLDEASSPLLLCMYIQAVISRNTTLAAHALPLFASSMPGCMHPQRALQVSSTCW